MSNFIQEIELLDVVRHIGRESKKYQAKTLQGIERFMDKNSPEFQEIRKLILDEYNDYTRSVLRVIFGDIEYLIK